jgi:hypothetical protein
MRVPSGDHAAANDWPVNVRRVSASSPKSYVAMSVSGLMSPYRPK